jgi:tetratricopeptide (TPR) repeat protein
MKVLFVLSVVILLLLDSNISVIANEYSSPIPVAERKKSWFHSLASRLFGFGSNNKRSSPTMESKSPDIIEASKIAADHLQQLVHEADLLISTGNVEAAVDKLIPVLQDQPDHQQANAYMGAILLGLGQIETAEPLLITAASRANWTDASATINLAKVLRLQHKNDFALKSLFHTYNRTALTRKTEEIDERVVIDPQLRLQLVVDIADTFYAMQNYSQAAEWYLSAAVRFATFAANAAQNGQPVHFNLTQVWIQASTLYYPEGRSDINRAEAVFIQAVQFAPNDADLVYNLGLVLYMTDRAEQALVFFGEALRLTGNHHADALAAYATALHSLRRFEEAERVYVLALLQMPDHIVLLANYARLLHSLPGRTADTTLILQRAYDLDPSHPDVVVALQAVGARIIPNTAEQVTDLAADQAISCPGA